MMTKRDYELIVKVLRKTNRDAELSYEQFRVLHTNFADALKEENSQFDRNKFYTACIEEN